MATPEYNRSNSLNWILAGALILIGVFTISALVIMKSKAQSNTNTGLYNLNANVTGVAPSFVTGNNMMYWVPASTEPSAQTKITSGSKATITPSTINTPGIKTIYAVAIVTDHGTDWTLPYDNIKGVSVYWDGKGGSTCVGVDNKVDCGDTYTFAQATYGSDWWTYAVSGDSQKTAIVMAIPFSSQVKATNPIYLVGVSVTDKQDITSSSGYTQTALSQAQFNETLSVDSGTALDCGVAPLDTVTQCTDQMHFLQGGNAEVASIKAVGTAWTYGTYSIPTSAIRFTRTANQEAGYASLTPIPSSLTQLNDGSDFSLAKDLSSPATITTYLLVKPALGVLPGHQYTGTISLEFAKS